MPISQYPTPREKHPEIEYKGGGTRKTDKNKNTPLWNNNGAQSLRVQKIPPRTMPRPKNSRSRRSRSTDHEHRHRRQKCRPRTPWIPIFTSNGASNHHKNIRAQRSRSKDHEKSHRRQKRQRMIPELPIFS